MMMYGGLRSLGEIYFKACKTQSVLGVVQTIEIAGWSILLISMVAIASALERPCPFFVRVNLCQMGDTEAYSKRK